MTRDEILSIPVGRALDAAVAEHVMGHLPPFVQRPCGGPPPRMGVGGMWVQDAVMLYDLFDANDVRVPNYSTRIADAWLVVERLGVSQRIRVTSSCVTHGCDINTPHAGRFIACAEGESAPKAICRAALLAHFRSGETWLDAQKAEGK